MEINNNLLYLNTINLNSTTKEKEDTYLIISNIRFKWNSYHCNDILT